MRYLEIIRKIKRKGITKDILDICSKDELRLLHKILDEIEEKGKSDTLDVLWREDFEERPVSIDEFLENDYYLGKVGSDVYPKWREELRVVCNPFENISEWIIKGSIGCVVGDTRIPLLDGTAPTIKELADRGEEAEFWVYSVNTGDRRIETRRGSNARKTGKSQAVYEVVLDNGESVRATSDHRFMLRSGMYRRVENLREGDSLMPLYTRYDPYEQFKDPEVVAVRFSGYEDVYDIEVEGTHNYATSAGVFIHNSGKTYSAVIALIYKMYYLLCLRDPQVFYGLGRGTPIVFGFFNIYKYLVRATSYQYLVTWLRDNSPYFKKWRLPKDGKKERDIDILNLPKNLRIALGAQAIHALGQNLIGGILDEAEFGKSRSMTSQEKSQVEDLYEQVRERIDSRFMQGGGLNPGILILVSSAKDYESFIEPHSRAKRDIVSVRTTQFALYEVKEERFRDSKRFKVVVGDRFSQSYILEGDVPPPREDATVVEVPVEFREHFDYDIDEAIRNIAGIPTHGEILFYPQRNQLKSLLESCERVHPFNRDTIELSLEEDIAVEDYFDVDLVSHLRFKSAKVRVPLYYPAVNRFIHVDLAKNHDCAGVSMVCLPMSKVVDRVVDDKVVRMRDFVVFVDFMLRVRAAHGSEIDVSRISSFVFFLIKVCRFRVKKVTYDQFQSLESIQRFKKAKIESKELSVDRNPGPYRALKRVAREGRLDAYYYDPFFSEMSRLEDRTQDGGSMKNKIDHPPGHSKDVSDAVCGATFSAMTHKQGITDTSQVEEQKRRAAARAKVVAMDSYRPDKVSAVTVSRVLTDSYRTSSELNDLFDED